MDRIVVVVFDGESQAYEGEKALKALHDEGSISLYGDAVIAKDGSGQVTIKQVADRGPVGTTLGLLTGSLIGLLAGPAGAAAGASAGAIAGAAVAGGTAGGSLYDLGHLGVGEDFLAEVGQQLQPGKCAVVAEIEEEWVTPVDTRMAAAGGVVTRRTRGEVLKDMLNRDAEALDAELTQLQTEYEHASQADKAKLQAQIDATKSKLQATQDRIKAHGDATRHETESKMQTLREQLAKAPASAKASLEARKAALEQRLAQLRSEHAQHNGGPQQAQPSAQAAGEPAKKAVTA